VSQTEEDLTKDVGGSMEMQMTKIQSDLKLEIIGWKRISGEVFRKPKYPILFSVLIGSGAQVTLATIVIAFYTFQGTFDPMHRGGLYTLIFVLTAMLGGLAGFISARFYKLFNGTDWVICAMGNAFFVPMVFIIYFVTLDVVDFFARAVRTPLTKSTQIFGFWLFLNALTIFFGTWIGYVMPKIELPVKVSRMARPCPSLSEKPFYATSLMTLPVGSFVCFLCIGTETFYLISSIWRESYYMMYVYLMLSLLMLVVVAGQVSVVQTYVFLKHEDYGWWWPSFLIGFLVSVFVMLVSYDFYFFLDKDASMGSFIVFSMTAAVMSLWVGLIGGFASFMGSYLMVNRMYAKVASKNE
jgi:transmembrane 9 superfamily member 2/4